MLRISAAALVLALVPAGGVCAQSVPFTSSNLPIFLIDTGGVPVPDEPKIPGTMRVVYGGEGVRNAVAGPFTHYDGPVGVEQRGATSRTLSPKDPYAVETRDAAGEDRDVALLGFPKEADWVLLAPYVDKSLLRDALAYEMARRMGRYASRARPVELVLNGDYKGVFWLMEKIKRDAGRVVMANLRATDLVAPAVTGGYLMKFDKKSGADTVRYALPTRSRTGYPMYVQFHHPKLEDLVDVQRMYMLDYLARFDRMMASPTARAEYPTWIDTASWVDYFIVQEATRNVDAYRLSAYFYKHRDTDGGRLVMGPVWDFNLAFGNANFYNAAGTTGWQVDLAIADDPFPVPPWWNVVRADPAFQQQVATRWAGLRRGPLHTDSLVAWIDATAATLGEAQARNFQRWPILNLPVHPGVFVGGSYANEVNHVKTWLRNRLAWIDRNLPAASNAASVETSGTLSLVPASALPARDASMWTASLPAPARLRVDVYDALGRRVLAVYDGDASGSVALRVEAGRLAPGAYVLRAEANGRAVTARLPVAR